MDTFQLLLEYLPTEAIYKTAITLMWKNDIIFSLNKV